VSDDRVSIRMYTRNPEKGHVTVKREARQSRSRLDYRTAVHGRHAPARKSGPAQEGQDAELPCA
jgi:hypothetical protein